MHAAVAKNRLAALALALIAIPLFPAFYVQTFSPIPFSERYLYLPSVGFGLIAGIGCGWLQRKVPRHAVAALMAAFLLVGAYSILTARRNRVWRDEATFFSTIARQSPDSEIAHGNLGNALLDEGRENGGRWGSSGDSQKIRPLRPSVPNFPTPLSAAAPGLITAWPRTRNA